MSKLLISVKDPAHLKPLLRIVRDTGYLSNRLPLSIELPEEHGKEAISKLESANIPFSIKTIGRSGELRAIAPQQPEHAPIEPAYKPQTPTTFTAFGESKTAREWSKDPRCVVNEKTLWRRLMNLDWLPERAITEPARVTPPPKMVSAFGEEKTIAEWSKDPRRKVPEKCVAARIRQGWSVERSLTDPIGRSSPKKLINTHYCPKCGCDRATCDDKSRKSSKSRVRRFECVRCLSKFSVIKTA